MKVPRCVTTPFPGVILLRRYLLLLLISLLGAAPASAQNLSDLDKSVFFFGGRFHTEWFSDGLNPFVLHWEDNYIAGGGVQQTVFNFYDISVGGELGLAGRFGTPGNSLEVWGGMFIRYDGLTLGPVRISPSYSVGLSAATAPIGIEARRAALQNIDVPLLIYLGPEVSLSLVDQPNWEVFWRRQHRSGGFGYIHDFDGSNAHVVGLRYKFE